MNRIWKALPVWAAFLILVSGSCKEKPVIPVAEQLQGGWISLSRNTKYFRFSGDSVEFADGLFCEGGYSEVVKIAGYSNYQGHFAPFKIKKDSIFYLEPCFGKWQLLGQIGLLRNDSLVLKMPLPEVKNEFRVVTFSREQPAPVQSRNFDKIVFSEISWNYTPLTGEISIDKNGNVYFSGATWHHPPGFYYAKTDTGYVNYLFDKFNRADFLTLPDNIDDGCLDGSKTFTTLVKAGRIVKTVKHHHCAYIPYFPGTDTHLMAAIFKTLKTYSAVKNLPTKLEPELKPQSSALPVTVLNNLLFFDGRKLLELSPSEALYFWTELQKAKTTTNTFKPVYKLFCSERFGSIEKQEGKHPDALIYELATDGRYFKFPDKNGKPRLYDLGYNFLDGNNLISRFEVATASDREKIKARAKGYIY